LHAKAAAGWAALLAALLAYAIFNARADYAYQYAFDLYHPWGIRAAREAAGHAVNPYVDTARVGAYVGDIAQSSPSRALRAAGGFWQQRNEATRFEPTGTPLYYALFAFLPQDYDAAHALLATLQFLAVGAGVYLLGRTRGWSRGASLCMAAAVWATFNPFTQDVKFGNVNSIQFLAVAAFIAVAQRAPWSRSWLDRAYLPALALFVLAKPNTGLIALALAAHYLQARGVRRFATGAWISLVVMAAGIAAGAAWLGGLDAWGDWYRYTQGMNGGTLLYTAREGNLSIVKMLSETGGATSVGGYALAAAIVLAAAVLLALSARGREPARLAPGLRALLADPWLAASIAVLATFAVSPLMWPHYWVMALVPFMRLFLWRGRWDATTLAAALAYALLSRPVLGALYDPARGAAIYTFMMFSWTPLVVALLLECAAVSRGEPRAAGAHPVAA